MKDIDLKNIKKVHFIGVGGIGISAVARMMVLEEKIVTANDLDEFELVKELRKMGVDTKIGTDFSVIPKDTELVIYSIAWEKLAPELLEYVKNTGVLMLTYPESLGLISKDKYTIAVAGTHGKTTTTAMIAQVLIEAGLDPTVIVGSLLKSGTNFVAGKSKYLVVEACEYKRSFLNIKPDIAIITNIDDDHLDYYKDLAGIQKGFSEFIQGIKEGGMLVTNLGDKNVTSTLSVFDKKVLDYTSVQENILLGVPGQHNIRNAKAVFVVAHELGIPKEKILSGLKNFTGTWRRFEKIGETSSGALVYDDYAHHPTEIQATLEAAREKFPKERIFAVFQPHLYSRTKEHFYEFGKVFALADQTLILPIYAARELKDSSISNQILVQELQKEGRNATAFETFESTVEFLNSNLKEGDVVMTIGAGDIYKVAKMLIS